MGGETVGIREIFTGRLFDGFIEILYQETVGIKKIFTRRLLELGRFLKGNCWN